jgi:TolA-binding protein
MKSRRCTAFFAFAVLLAASAAAQEAPQGELKLKESTPASQKAYNMAAGVHNGGVYDVAAGQWKKFLDEYPNDTLAPRAAHYLGICYMQVKPPKYDEAVKTYADLIVKYPKFENLADALLNLGWCQYQLGLAGAKEQFAAADKTFTQLIATEKHVDQALYFQGESRYLQGNREGAIEAYGKLVQEQPKSSLRRDAIYALGVAQEELGKFDEAGKTYELFLTEFGEAEDAAALATEIHMRKAETILQAGVKAEEAGQADDAKKLFAEAEAMFAAAAAVEGFASADHATYRQALCASKQGKFAEAGALYAKVADNPQSVYVKEATLDAGRSYYQGQKYEEAEARFRKVLELGGSDVPEAAHWLARILIDHKKAYPEAAKLAADMIAKAQDSPYLVNLKVDEADAKFETPDTRAESLKLFAAIAKDHADNPLAASALYNAAYSAMQLKQYDEALKFADDFLKTNPDHRLAPDVKYVAAESNLFLKKYPEAEKFYADLATSYKQHADLEQWQLRLGLVNYLQQKYAETVAVLSPVVASFKSKDNIAEGQYYIGASQYRQDALDAAVAALSASITANPKWRRSDEVLLDLARAQDKQGKHADAIASTKKMLAEFPQSDLLDRAHFQLAQYSYDSDDFKTAAAEYAEVVKNWPQSIFVPHSLYGQGWSQYRLDDNAGAITTFTALIEGHKENRLVPSAHNGRGICRQRTGDFEGGAADFTAFLATNPTGQEKADALYNLGLCQAGLKRFDEAAKTYETILKDVPDYAGKDKVLYELAWANKSQGKDADAVKYFASITTDHADSPLAAEAFYHVGEDQYSAEKYADAAKSYAAAKAKAGQGDIGEKSTYKLGWANYRLDKFDEAQKSFDEQVKTYPSGALAGDALFMVGECNFKLKKYADALPALEKALAANPSSDTIKVLALLHAGQSAGQLEKPDWQKAVTLLSQIPEKHKDSAYLPEALYELGWANFNLGQQDKALEFWSEATAASDGALAARSRFMMGEVKFAKKDFKGAIEDYVLVVFGYGGDASTDDVKNWQAKASLQAGQASAVLAGQTQEKPARDKLIADAKKYFTRVLEKHPTSDVAKAAEAQLKKLSGG